MSDIKQIELTIQDARGKVALRDMALKLANNRDFKKLIMDEYFINEAARLVEIVGDSRLSDERDDIVDAMKGISNLRQFLRHKIMEGDVAEESIQEHLALLDEEEMEEVL